MIPTPKKIQEGLEKPSETQGQDFGILGCPGVGLDGPGEFF